MVRAARPDLGISHFTHTPFCGPSSIRVLPDRHGRSDLRVDGVACPSGFHTPRWARAYVGIGARGAGPRPRRHVVVRRAARARPRRLGRIRGRLTPRAEVAPPSSTSSSATASSSSAATASTCRRTSCAGSTSYDELLDGPSGVAGAGRVRRHAQPRRARTSPSTWRTSRRSTRWRRELNERWAHRRLAAGASSTPRRLRATIAGFTRYDVLLVNPVKDGLNLVAKEGPLVNQRDGVVLPLTGGGRLRRARTTRCCAMHPYDIEQSADALHRALSMPDDERARARRAASASSPSVHTPQTWLDAAPQRTRADLGRRASSEQRRPGPAGPSTTTSASRISGGALVRRHPDAHRVRERARRRPAAVSDVEGGEVAGVVAGERRDRTHR